MTKYKVGDVVRIDPQLRRKIAYDGLMITNEMVKYAGKKAIIRDVSTTCSGIRYQIDLDKQEWSWNTETFNNSKFVLEL